MRFPPTSIPRRTLIQDGLLEAELCTRDYTSNLGHPNDTRSIPQWSAHRSINTAVSSSLQKTTSKHFGVAIIRPARITSACGIGAIVSHVTMVFFSHTIPGSMARKLPDRRTVFASIERVACLTTISTNNTVGFVWPSSAIFDSPHGITQVVAPLTESAGPQEPTGCKTSSA